MNCTRCSGRKTFYNQECVKCGGKGKLNQNDYIMFLITKNVGQRFKIKKDAKRIKEQLLQYEN